MEATKIMKIITRKKYLNEMTGLMNITDIKVITGIRRSGKLKIMEAFIQQIRETDSKSNIIHINFNLSEQEE